MIFLQNMRQRGIPYLQRTKLALIGQPNWLMGPKTTQKNYYFKPKAVLWQFQPVWARFGPAQNLSKRNMGTGVNWHEVDISQFRVRTDPVCDPTLLSSSGLTWTWFVPQTHIFSFLFLFQFFLQKFGPQRRFSCTRSPQGSPISTKLLPQGLGAFQT